VVHGRLTGEALIQPQLAVKVLLPLAASSLFELRPAKEEGELYVVHLSFSQELFLIIGLTNVPIRKDSYQ
tara:strand:- start:5908 stop:6117 length:210 start_codon:yes stop_codon:yes gene_type:complete